MADKKISELNNITGSQVDDTNDELAIVDASGNETKAITRAELFSSMVVPEDATIHGATVGRGAGSISTNTAVGNGALSSNTTGTANTANGYQALQFNTTGNFNTANGRSALESNTTGSFNTANGRSALQSNTEGNDNTANGYQALRDNTTGSENTANGYAALRDNTTGNNNTANGYAALLNNTTGSENTANGRTALQSNTTGSNNTATGYQALRDNTIGNNNIAVGYDAGRSGSPFQITTQSNRIVMGNDDHTDAYIKVAWTVTSDARDKTDFAPIPHGLEFINAIEPTEYQFRAGGRDSEQGDGKRRYGFLAQDILALEGDNPVITDNEEPENLKLKESQLVPVLVNAVKELSSQVEDLKAEITQLKEK